MFKAKSPGLCVTLIKFYQRYISPYKGFSCAHRVLCGGVSCSGYALTQFQTKDPIEAYKATRVRMRDCGELYREYMSKKSDEEQQAAKKRKILRYLLLINPRTYLLIARSYLIRNWPKRNQQGDLQ